MLMTMRMAMLMKPLTWSPLTLLTWPGEMVPRWDPSAQVARLHKWHRSLQHGQFSSLRDHHHILNFERLIIMSITVTVMSPLLFNPVRVATIIQDPSKVILESVRRIFHGNYSCQVVCQCLISLFVPILFQGTKNVFLRRAKTGPDGGLFLTQVIWLTMF